MLNVQFVKCPQWESDSNNIRGGEPAESRSVSRAAISLSRPAHVNLDLDDLDVAVCVDHSAQS